MNLRIDSLLTGVRWATWLARRYSVQRGATRNQWRITVRRGASPARLGDVVGATASLGAEVLTLHARVIGVSDNLARPEITYRLLE